MKDTPLGEINLRRYEKPYDLKKRELVKKLCLSVGLLQPGDSRDVVVDVLLVLLQARKGNNALSSEEVKKAVEKLREKEKLAMLGITSSNVRRQLRRIRELFIAEKVKNKYRIKEFGSVEDAITENVEKFLVPNIMNRIKEYANAVDQQF